MTASSTSTTALWKRTWHQFCPSRALCSRGWRGFQSWERRLTTTVTLWWRLHHGHVARRVLSSGIGPRCWISRSPWKSGSGPCTAPLVPRSYMTAVGGCPALSSGWHWKGWRPVTFAAFWDEFGRKANHGWTTSRQPQGWDYVSAKRQASRVSGQGTYQRIMDTLDTLRGQLPIARSLGGLCVGRTHNGGLPLSVKRLRGHRGRGRDTLSDLGVMATSGLSWHGQARNGGLWRSTAWAGRTPEQSSRTGLSIFMGSLEGHNYS